MHDNVALMPRNADDTREHLMRAAEQLFAERGIQAVSLREINRAAGQRNATALQYHFENRRGLLRAVLARHDQDVEARRHADLDALEALPLDLRRLSAALVEPTALKLSDRNGGRDYLRIKGELMNRPDPRFDRAALSDRKSSINRWRAAVAPLVPELALDRLHRRFTALRIMHVELARRAAGARRRDDRLFVSHLVDMIAAILAAPLSDETSAMVTKRREG